MANDKSVTDIEATNIAPVDTEVAKPEAPPKKDMTEVQVDAKPDESVDFGDFLAVKEGIPAAQKQTEVKAEDKKEVKVDDKVATKPDDKKIEDVKVEDKKVEPKVEQVKTEDKKADDKEDKRVYDDIPETLRPIFKKLHNDPFNTFKPIVKELETTKAKLQETEKQLTEVKKGALPDNYYEHQRGYVLAPEFEQAYNKANLAEQIANHWENQLDRIRKGEATYQDLNVNTKGELVLSDPMQVTKDAEAKVVAYAKFANNQLSERQFDVRMVAQQHEAVHKNAVAEVSDFENRAFKVFTEGENAKQWEPVIKDTINKTFPAAFRNNPLASGYAKALITIGKLGEQLKALKEGKSTEVIKQDDGKVISAEDKKKAGPSAADMANAGSKTVKSGDDDEDFDINEFKKVKEEGSVYVRR